MFELLAKLESLRLALRSGAGKVSVVLEQFQDTLKTASDFLKDVESGKVFESSPVQKEKLVKEEEMFTSMMTEKTPVGASPSEFNPALIVPIAQVVLKLIELIKTRRNAA